MKKLLLTFLSIVSLAGTASAEVKLHLQAGDVADTAFWSTSNSNGLLDGINANASHSMDWTRLSKSGANLTDIPTRLFSDIQSRPTTLSGYGITDGLVTTNNLSDLTSTSTARTNLGAQASSSILTSLAALANATGRLANNGSGAFSYSQSGDFFAAVTAKSVNFSVGSDPKGQVYPVVTGSSTVTATLPTASAKWAGILFKSDSGPGHIATSPATVSLTHQNQSLLVWSDGTTYHASVLQPVDLSDGATLNNITVTGGLASTDNLTFPTHNTGLRFVAGNTMDIQDNVANLFMQFTGGGGNHIVLAQNFYASGHDVYMSDGSGVGGATFSLDGGVIQFDGSHTTLQGDGAGSVTLNGVIFSGSALTMSAGSALSLDSGSTNITGDGHGDLTITASNTFFPLGGITVAAPIQLAGYTVAMLPAGFVGQITYVTDATMTMITGLGLTVVGGGSHVVPVFYDGTSWKIQ